MENETLKTLPTESDLLTKFRLLSNYDLVKNSLKKELDVGDTINSNLQSNKTSFIKIEDLPNYVTNINQINFDTPRIYLSFHYNNYALAYLSLIYKKIPFSLMANKREVDESVFHKYVNVDSIYNSVYKVDNFSIYDTLDFVTLYKGLRDINSKKSIFLFLDDVESRNKKSLKNTVEIKFLDGTINVSTGIFKLAFKSKIKICPIFIVDSTSRSNSQLRVYDEIDPNKFNNENEFIYSAAQKIYSSFEDFLRMRNSWIGWTNFGINNYSSKLNQYDSKYKLNDNLFLYSEIDKYYIFDSVSEVIYETTKNVYKILTLIKNQEITLNSDDITTYPLINDLYANKIIITNEHNSNFA